MRSRIYYLYKNKVTGCSKMLATYRKNLITKEGEIYNKKDFKRLLTVHEREQRRISDKTYKSKGSRGINNYKRYSSQECNIIMCKKVSDVEISKRLSRTLQAIESKRYKLNKNGYKHV
jgi:hypothetical protein